MLVVLSIVILLVASLGAAMCVGSMLARMGASDTQMRNEGRWPTQGVMLAGGLMIAASLCALSFLWA